MTTGELVQKSVYMYKILNGQFNCFEGYIVHYPQRRDVFYVRDKKGKKYYTVSEQPYEIHCDNLWMVKRDDCKARALFRERMFEQISEHEQAIERIYSLIDIIEEGLY